jgi:hypothetical protein
MESRRKKGWMHLECGLNETKESFRSVVLGSPSLMLFTVTRTVYGCGSIPIPVEKFEGVFS